jgi:MFS family permease
MVESSKQSNYRYYVVFLLFLTSVSNFSDRQVFALLIESIKHDLHVSDGEIGLLGGLTFAIFHSVAGLPLARLADTKPRRLVISAGIFAWSILTIGCGLAANFWQMVIARLGVGVGEATGTPTSHSLVADYFPKDRRAAIMALTSMGATAGIFVASLGGGWINQYYGWRMAFILLGIPGIFLSLLIFFTLKEPKRGQMDDKVYVVAPSMLTAIKGLLSIPSYRHIVAVAALHGFVGATGLFWYPAFMQRVHGLSSGETGTFMAFLYPPFSALGMLLMGRFADVLARRDMRWYLWIMAIATAGVAPFLLVFLLWPDRNALYVLMFVAFMAGAGIPALHAVTQYVAPPNARATASAINVLIIGLAGNGIGAAIVGFLNDALAPTFGKSAIRYSMTIIAVAGTWAAIHAIMAARTIRADAEKTAAAG